MTESGQLDLVDALREHEMAVEDRLTTMESQLSTAIDENPNDKLLMEMFDQVTDAEQSVQAVKDLLALMEQRDRENSL